MLKEVTDENIDQYKRARFNITSDMKLIEEKIRLHQPVVCMFSGNEITFRSTLDVKKLLEDIGLEIEIYYRHKIETLKPDEDWEMDSVLE